MGIVVFKTMAGDDLIGEICDKFDDYYSVTNLSQMIYHETDEGVRVQIAPVMPYTKGSIKMYKTSLLAEGEPYETLVNEFKRVFSPIIQSSGLVLPK